MSSPIIKVSSEVVYFDKKCKKLAPTEVSLRIVTPKVYALHGYFRHTDGSCVGYHENADRYFWSGSDGQEDGTERRLIGLGYTDVCGKPVHLNIHLSFATEDFPEGLDIISEWGKDVVSAYIVDGTYANMAWMEQDCFVHGSRRHSSRIIK